MLAFSFYLLYSLHCRTGNTVPAFPVRHGRFPCGRPHTRRGIRPASIFVRTGGFMFAGMFTERTHCVFFGTRGSAPQTGPEYALYGGNTSCLAFVPENDEKPALIVDAGTGLASCRDFLLQRRSRACTLLFTHGHLDHICGLPSFFPLFRKEWDISIFYPSGIMNDPLDTLFDGKTFPLKRNQLEAGIVSRTFTPGDEVLPGVLSAPVDHSLAGGCAFLFGGQVFVSGDCENPGKNPDMTALADKAKILVCDGTYEKEKMPFRRGWGHSCAEDWLDVRRPGQYLYLTHHEGNDTLLSVREKALKKKHSRIVLAREGLSFLACE